MKHETTYKDETDNVVIPATEADPDYTEDKDKKFASVAEVVVTEMNKIMKAGVEVDE